MSAILAIAHYEMLMHWRRRGIKVLVISLILILTAAVLILGATDTTNTGGNLDQLVNQYIDLTIIFLTWPALASLLIFVVPILFSDSVPIDEQQHTRELIQSLPVTPVQYLIGKLIGLWYSLLIGLAVALIVNALAWRLSAGSYDGWRYLEFWLVGALVMMINTGIALLIGATQPTRSRAAVVFIGVLVLSILLLNPQDESLLAYLSPARFMILNHYIGQIEGANLVGLFASTKVVNSLLIGAAEVFVVGILTWAWLRWKEQKA